MPPVRLATIFAQMVGECPLDVRLSRFVYIDMTTRCRALRTQYIDIETFVVQMWPDSSVRQVRRRHSWRGEPFCL